MSNAEFSVKFMGLVCNIACRLLFRISFFMGENNVTLVYETSEKDIFRSNINKKTQTGGYGSE